MRQQEPLISVIVPVYNAERYLVQCIKSIAGQSYQNIELLLIDNASTDSSPLICDQHAQRDNRIKVIHLKENVMASGARNTGVQAAAGEWVMFVDSDDFLDEKYGLDELVSYSRTINYEFDFLIFNYKRYFQNDDTLVNRPDFSADLIKEENKIEKVALLLKNSFIPAPSWGKLIKLQFLRTKGIEFVTGTNAEDIPWFLNLLEYCENFALTNIRLLVYRKQVTGAGTFGFNKRRYDDLLHIVTNESRRIASYSEQNPLKKILLSFLAYEYVILLATSANFRGKEFGLHLNELSSLKWLMKYNLTDKVRKTGILLRYLPTWLVAILLHKYARLIVNRT